MAMDDSRQLELTGAAEKDWDEKEAEPIGKAVDHATVDGAVKTVPRTVGPYTLGALGPVVGLYSRGHEGTCYDLNDHYSKPRTIAGVFVRSPVEAGVNAIAFLVLFAMTSYSVAVYGLGSVDWFTTPFKLIHFLFHVGIHIPPNWDDESKWDAKKRVRVINGIVFGLARYAVFFVIAWRLSPVWFVATCAVLALMTPLRLLGELIKTTFVALMICYAMLTVPSCSWAVYGVVLGLLVQMVGTGGYVITGAQSGWQAKWYLRDEERVPVAWHVIGDTGNALLLICSTFTPGFGIGAKDVLLWSPSYGVFPGCGVF